LQGGDVDMQTQSPDGFGKRRHEKVIVFKDAQKAKVDAYTEPEPECFFFTGFGVRHFKSGKIIQQGGENEKEQELFTPAGIKVVAGEKQENILNPVLVFGCEPVQQENKRKEDCEFDRIKEHACFGSYLYYGLIGQCNQPDGIFKEWLLVALQHGKCILLFSKMALMDVWHLFS
jgi:hypothetical protein